MGCASKGHRVITFRPSNTICCDFSSRRASGTTNNGRNESDREKTGRGDLRAGPCGYHPLPVLHNRHALPRPLPDRGHVGDRFYPLHAKIHILFHNPSVAKLPLNPDQTKRLFTGISETMIANLYGGLAVGVAQGILAGLSFWILGLSAPIPWALATGLASLVPGVGSALVWGPAAILLILNGHWANG